MTPKLGWLALALVFGASWAIASPAPSPSTPTPTSVSSSQATPPARRARIEEMLTLSGLKPKLDAAHQNAQDDLRAFARRQVALLGDVPANRKAELDGLAKAYVADLDAIAPRITWEGVSPPLIQFCADRYTDAELDAIIAFYKSGPGSKLRANSQDLDSLARAADQKFQAAIAPETFEATDRLKAQADAMRTPTTR